MFGPRCYLVPRDDGRTLIGSTLEFVGYRREVTAQAVRDLLDRRHRAGAGAGHRVAGAHLVELPPLTPDELPLLGSPGVAHLYLASGHYRTGILLAPITAEIVSALVLGAPPLPIDAFNPQRPRTLAFSR